MPPRDYANRTRKPRQPVRKGGGRPSSRRSYTNLLLSVIAALLALVIIGGLILRKDQEPPSVTTPPAAKPTAEADPLPARPQERWDYIKELENKQVQVDVPAAPKEGPWQMQCGSFRGREQAEAMKARIAFEGLESVVRTSEGSNGLWHKVVLGPYERKYDAEKDRQKLRRAKLSTCQIWKWQG